MILYHSIAYIVYWSDRTLQYSPFTPHSAIRPESRQIALIQINMEEMNPRGEKKNIPAEKLDNNGTPLNKESCDPVVELAAISTPFKGNQPNKGSSHVIDLNKTPQRKQRRRKYHLKAIIEGKPKRSRKLVTKNNVQSKENLTGKSKYVRKKGLNKIYTTLAEETVELIKYLMSESVKTSCRRSLNIGIGARDECFASRENATTHVGHAYDLTISMKLASNKYMSLPLQTQDPSKCSPSEAQPKEKSTAKRMFFSKEEIIE